MELNLRKLESNPDKIPSPDRDEMMNMAVTSFSQVKIDCKKAFNSLFVTNALDGSEDHLVSDKIMSLVGNEIKEFRKNMMKEKAPKDFNELLKSITPPKGIRRKNVEGSELYDCDGDEIAQDDQNINGKKLKVRHIH